MLKPIRRSSVVVGCSAALLLVLAGCTGGGDGPRPESPAPAESTTPAPADPRTSAATSSRPTEQVPSSEEAAAADAVRAYYRTTDDLFSDPASDIDRATDVAGSAELDELRRLLQEQRVRGERQTGSVEVVSVALTEALAGPPASIRADVCIDVSGVDVLDAAGTSIVSSERALRSLVHVVVVDRGRNGWLVEQTDAVGEPCSES